MTRDFGLPRAVATLVFVFLVLYPLSRIFQRVDFAVAVPPELVSTALMSVKQAALSLGASLALGIPLGIYYAPAWSPALRSLSIAAFSMPSLLVIGMMNLALRGTEYRFGLGSVVAAHAFLNTPWIALATAEGLRSVPRRWVDAARTLGATRARAFFRIEFPWIARSVALASAQVFALCLTSFAVVLILGGGPPVVSLETEIYASVRGGGLALSRAAWFAFAQLGLAALPLIAVAGFRSRAEYRDTLAGEGSAARSSATERRVIAHGIAGAWLLLPGVFFLKASSVAGLEDLFADEVFRAALAVSFRIAFATAAVSLLLAGVFAWGARNSRFVRMLAGIPAGLSPLIVALGFFLAYAEYVDPFEGSVAGMVFVQAALFLPFGLRFFLPLLEEESSGPRRELRLAARTLGASSTAAWRRLEWPRWRSAGMRLGALVFVWSFSELAAASFFGSERLTTLGVLLARWMAQYRFEDVNSIFFGLYLFSTSVLLFVGRKA